MEKCVAYGGNRTLLYKYIYIICAYYYTNKEGVGMPTVGNHFVENIHLKACSLKYLKRRLDLNGYNLKNIYTFYMVVVV